MYYYASICQLLPFLLFFILSFWPLHAGCCWGPFATGCSGPRQTSAGISCGALRVLCGTEPKDDVRDVAELAVAVANAAGFSEPYSYFLIPLLPATSSSSLTFSCVQSDTESSFFSSSEQRVETVERLQTNREHFTVPSRRANFTVTQNKVCPWAEASNPQNRISALYWWPALLIPCLSWLYLYLCRPGTTLWLCLSFSLCLKLWKTVLKKSVAVFDKMPDLAIV